MKQHVKLSTIHPSIQPLNFNHMIYFHLCFSCIAGINFEMSWMWAEVSVPSVVCVQEMYHFIWYAGKNFDVSTELQEIQATVDEAAAQKTSLMKAFRTREAKKGLMISFGLMLFQQLSGVNAVIFYTTNIFEVSMT